MKRLLQNYIGAAATFAGALIMTAGLALPFFAIAQGTAHDGHSEGWPSWASDAVIGVLAFAFVALLGAVWRLAWKTLKDEDERQNERITKVERKVEGLEEVRVDVARVETKVDMALDLLEKIAKG